jgi:hypothetical protein
MWAVRRCASTATTTMPPTLVRLTATMGLIGSLVECSSAPAPGMAGDMVGAAVGATVITGVAVGATVAVGAVEATMATQATEGEATAVDFVVTGFTVAMDSTEPQAEASTVVAEASTVVAEASTAVAEASTAVAEASTAAAVAAASMAAVAVAVSMAAAVTVADTGNLFRR